MDPRKRILSEFFANTSAVVKQIDDMARRNIAGLRSPEFYGNVLDSEITAAHIELEIMHRGYDLAQLKYFILTIGHLIDCKYAQFDNIINANIAAITSGTWDYNSVLSAMIPICTLVADSNDQNVIDYCTEILTFVGAPQKSSYRDDIIELMIIAVRLRLDKRDDTLVLNTITLMRYVEENTLGFLVESNIDEEIEFIIDELIRKIKSPDSNDFPDMMELLEKRVPTQRVTEIDGLLGAIADIVV